MVQRKLFSVVRQRGGWNLNPYAKSFRLSFLIQTITDLIKLSVSAKIITVVFIKHAI